MSEAREKIVELIRTRGVVRPRDVEALGYHRKYLRSMVDDGILERVGRGLYRLVDADPDERSSLAEVIARVPRAVLCLMTALSWHGLTTQSPHEVWIAIPANTWVPVDRGTQIRVIRMTEHWLAQGVETVDLDGITGHVTNPARTVVDCFWFRREVGLDVAIEALRDGLERSLFTPAQLHTLARDRRVLKTMRPYIEALVA